MINSKQSDIDAPKSDALGYKKKLRHSLRQVIKMLHHELISLKDLTKHIHNNNEHAGQTKSVHNTTELHAINNHYNFISAIKRLIKLYITMELH